jgi:putative glutamine amidotransferase
MSKLPIVGIVCDRRVMGQHPFQIAGEKYIIAVREGAGAIPVLLPSLEAAIPPQEILDAVDGLFFTGSPSNVSPRRYGGPAPREGVLQDEYRDATTLPLLTSAVERGMPLLAVCRGFQELNVAMGGTLYQHVQEVEGRRDHRANRDLDLDGQYGPVHNVAITGGLLKDIVGKDEIVVNSLHAQGVDKLAPRMRADAVADDGQIEAISLPNSRNFVLGVQWHPEWRWDENETSRRIFSAFGAALRKS